MTTRKSNCGPRHREASRNYLSLLIALVCLTRAVPLLVSRRPGTPLRVLCIAAIDTLHGICRGKLLSRRQVADLAVLLDFEACANAKLDQKTYCPEEYQVTRQQLLDAGHGASVREFLHQLQFLERRRPIPDSHDDSFEAIRSYRESVGKLFLEMAASTAFGDAWNCRAAGSGSDGRGLELLFRIVMQCQIIDDVLDFRKDTSAGLPTFLTACESPERAIEQTAESAQNYAKASKNTDFPGSLPIRIALAGISLTAQLVILIRQFEFRLAGNRLVRLRQSQVVRGRRGSV